MRRLFGLALTLAMLAGFAVVPASAQAPPGCPEPVPGHTYTCTVHMSGGTQTMPVTPIACPDGSTIPAGLLTITINNGDRKSTRLNSSHMSISYAVFCLKKKIIPY